MKKYIIGAENGKLICYDMKGNEIKDWGFYDNKNMKEPKLFVNGVGVATKDEIAWVGLKDEEYNNIVNGKWVCPSFAVKSEKSVTKAGKMIFKAERENGDIVITVLDKNYCPILAECKVIKK